MNETPTRKDVNSLRRSSRIKSRSGGFGETKWIISETQASAGRTRKRGNVDVFVQFPKFPVNANEMVDFCLPDDFIRMISHELANLPQTDCIAAASQDDSNLSAKDVESSLEVVNCGRPASDMFAQEFKPLHLLRGSVTEPIQMVCISDLSKMDEELSKGIKQVVVTCQSSRISTWMLRTGSDDYILFEEHLTSPVHADTARWHQCEIRDEILMLLFNEEGEEVNVWKHTCFPKCSGASRTLILRASITVPDNCATLTCKIDDHQFLYANTNERQTVITMFELGLKSCEGKAAKFAELDCVINSLLLISSLDNALLSCSQEKLHIWNLRSGRIVKEVLLDRQPDINRCHFAESEAGYLFLVFQMKPDKLHNVWQHCLVAVNLRNNKWGVIKSYETVQGTGREIVCDRHLLAEISSSGYVSVWDLFDGNLTAVLNRNEDGDPATAIAYDFTGSLMAIGDLRGDVTIYDTLQYSMSESEVLF